MTARPLPTTAEAKFKAALDAYLRERERPAAFVVPQLSADPPETEATNLWMRNDGRLRGRYRNGSGTFTYVDYPMRSDWGSPAAVPANPAAPPPGPTPQSYRTTWTATWSRSYANYGGSRVDSLGLTNLMYGASGTDGYGQQRSLIGFDAANIASTLAGSTIQSIEMTITNLEAYWDTVQVFFGMHNNTTFPEPQAPWEILFRRSASATWGVEKVTVTLPLLFAQALRDGIAKGLVLEAPSAERSYYGYAAGVGGAYDPPEIHITYAK